MQQSRLSERVEVASILESLRFDDELVTRARRFFGGRFATIRSTSRFGTATSRFRELSSRISTGRRLSRPFAN